MTGFRNINNHSRSFARRLSLSACGLMIVAAAAPAATTTAGPPPGRAASFAPPPAPRSYAAPQRRKRVDPTDVNNEDKKDKDDAKTPASPKATPERGRRRPPPPPIPSFDVTFKTDMPEVEITQDLGSYKRPLGKTNADGVLAAKLTRGKHQITASRKGLPYKNHQIEVSADSTSFTFTINPAPAAPARASESSAAPAPTPNETSAVEPSPAPSVDDIINRYLAFGTTDSVTAADWEYVVKQTTVALEQDPGVSLLKAQQLFAQGQLAYLRGDHDEAVVKFRAAEVAQPSLALIHYGLGRAYLVTKQPREAFKSFQRAAKLDPKLALAPQGMGQALSEQGKENEAKKYFEQANRLGGSAASAGATPGAPSNVSDRLNAARALMKSKRWEQALAELNVLAETRPAADVFLYIGDCYVALKKPFSAAPAYLKAMELDENSALAAYSYGKLMFEQREDAKAMDALERAIVKDQTGMSIDRNKAREMADKARERLRKK